MSVSLKRKMSSHCPKQWKDWMIDLDDVLLPILPLNNTQWYCNFKEFYQLFFETSELYFLSFKNKEILPKNVQKITNKRNFYHASRFFI